MKSKKRVLWLANHLTLMEAECNLLLDLGFEVYVPKKTQASEEERSTGIDYQYDKSLTIPSEDLELLNSHNFYTDEIPENIAKIINNHFVCAICVHIYPMLFHLAKVFKKTLIIRAFGYEGETNYEGVTNSFKTHCSLNLIQKIIKKLTKPAELVDDNNIMRQFYKIRKKLYLGVAFNEITENETVFFKQRSIYLPATAPQSVYEHENTWVGDIEKIMFVCPSIESAYYNKIYSDFKNDFGDMPHSVFGKQTKEYPEDPNIIGFIEREEYDKALKHYKCMFYHSREKRHSHYHMHEAIIFGMPLVFMSDGLLESAGGSNQPGMAKTIEEAREKTQRILNNDIDFINSILESQHKIIEEMRYQNVKKAWEKNFLPRMGGN